MIYKSGKSDSLQDCRRRRRAAVIPAVAAATIAATTIVVQLSLCAVRRRLTCASHAERMKDEGAHTQWHHPAFASACTSTSARVHEHVVPSRHWCYTSSIGTIPIRSLPKTNDKRATRLSTHGSYP